MHTFHLVSLSYRKFQLPQVWLKFLCEELWRVWHSFISLHSVLHSLIRSCVWYISTTHFLTFFDLLILPFTLGYKGQKSVLSWFVEMFRLNFKSQIWQDGGGRQPVGSIRASPRSLRDPRRLCGETGRQKMSLQSPEYLWKNWEEADLMRRYFFKKMFSWNWGKEMAECTQHIEELEMRWQQQLRWECGSMAMWTKGHVVAVGPVPRLPGISGLPHSHPVTIL